MNSGHFREHVAAHHFVANITLCLAIQLFLTEFLSHHPAPKYQGLSAQTCVVVVVVREAVVVVDEQDAPHMYLQFFCANACLIASVLMQSRAKTSTPHESDSECPSDAHRCAAYVVLVVVAVVVVAVVVVAVAVVCVAVVVVVNVVVVDVVVKEQP